MVCEDCATPGENKASVLRARSLDPMWSVLFSLSAIMQLYC